MKILMIQTGERSTNLIQEIRWNSIFLNILSQSWHLQALYSNWKKVKGIQDPEPLNLTTNFKDWKNMTERPNDLWDDMSILNSL